MALLCWLEAPTPPHTQSSPHILPARIPRNPAPGGLGTPDRGWVVPGPTFTRNFQKKPVLPSILRAAAPPVSSVLAQRLPVGARPLHVRHPPHRRGVRGPHPPHRAQRPPHPSVRSRPHSGCRINRRVQNSSVVCFCWGIIKKQCILAFPEHQRPPRSCAPPPCQGSSYRLYSQGFVCFLDFVAVPL